MAILALAAILFFSYVFLTDRLTSEKLLVNMLEDKLTKTNIALELKNSAVSEELSIESMTAFAQNKGMIESRDGVSMFENGGVALFAPNMP